MISTTDLQYCLPGLSLSFEIVANVEDLVTNPEDDDQIPYWAELWPASRGLAQYIWEQIDFNGDRVLELGAGLGLPGLVAACKGARVTISDYQPEALKIASRNALRNGIEGVAFELAELARLASQREVRLDHRLGRALQPPEQPLCRPDSP